MKDAKGHGSDPRGAHAQGIVNAVPKIFDSRHGRVPGEKRLGYKEGTIHATAGDHEIGYLDYAAWGGKIHIRMINTDPDFRRQGVATKMMDHLKSVLPGLAINEGGRSPLGMAFRKGYDERR